MRLVPLLRRTALGVLLSLSSLAPALAAPVPIVAAENFYGELARQVGGEHVAVTSILSNPEQDPHSFEASPRTARDLAHARLVIYNGIGYDRWIGPLLSASPAPGREELVAAQLVGKRDGDNPHLWYLPSTMPAVARAIGAWLDTHDAAHKADYDARLATTLKQLQAVETRVAQMRQRYHGQPVTATEPVFGYMAEALGLEMRNTGFQLAVMNETEPSASDVAAFETDLRKRRVKALIYNGQTSDQMTRRLLSIARRAGVPVVAVSETQPPGKRFDQWQIEQLDALDKALAAQH